MQFEEYLDNDITDALPKGRAKGSGGYVNQVMSQSVMARLPLRRRIFEANGPSDVNYTD